MNIYARETTLMARSEENFKNPLAEEAGLLLNSKENKLVKIMSTGNASPENQGNSWEREIKFSLRCVKERASSDQDPQDKNRETHKTKLEKDDVFGVWQVLCWWEQHPLK